MPRIGRPSIDFEPFKDFVYSLLETPRTWPGITECVIKEMGRHVGERTLRRQCALWGFKRKQPIDRSQLVVLFITEHFRTTRDSDREIARLLETAGVVISADHVAIIRIENNLFRREQTLQDQQARQHIVTEAMRQAYAEGSVREYGREMMAAHLRRSGVVATRYKLHFCAEQVLLLFIRDEISAALVELDPEAFRARQKPFKRTHGRNFTTPGPDSLWAIDGHHKLSRWGFEIYAAIDAYSRKIIWIYVGIDAVTSISVAKQYMDVIRQTGVIPYRLRADRGTETPVIGDIQYELRRQTEFFNGEILLEEIETFPFDQAFLFGTSMKNQRIESWWRHLQTGALRPWRVRSSSHTRGA
jgi:hypothetical protein